MLLLDEPGLHLHPGGQKNLLERLDAYAKKNTLIYTTHLPFLVDLREPKRIRCQSVAMLPPGVAERAGALLTALRHAFGASDAQTTEPASPRGAGR